MPLIVFGLVPKLDLDDLGIDEALGAVYNRFFSAAGLPAELLCQGDVIKFGLAKVVYKAGQGLVKARHEPG